jgi:hypothetical protein
VQTDWPDNLRVHSDGRNLIIHIIAVPLFVGSFVCILLYLFRCDLASMLIAGVLSGRWWQQFRAVSDDLRNDA